MKPNIARLHEKNQVWLAVRNNVVLVLELRHLSDSLLASEDSSETE